MNQIIVSCIQIIMILVRFALIRAQFSEVDQTPPFKIQGCWLYTFCSEVLVKNHIIKVFLCFIVSFIFFLVGQEVRDRFSYFGP
jgi:hypothetical protein